MNKSERLYIEKMDEMRECYEAQLHELGKCCTERGKRLQIMYNWMCDTMPLNLNIFNDFIGQHPEAKNWFDENGCPNEDK